MPQSGHGETTVSDEPRIIHTSIEAVQLVFEGVDPLRTEQGRDEQGGWALGAIGRVPSLLAGHLHGLHAGYAIGGKVLGDEVVHTSVQVGRQRVHIQRPKVQELQVCTGGTVQAARGAGGQHAYMEGMASA